MNEGTVELCMPAFMSVCPFVRPSLCLPVHSPVSLSPQRNNSNAEMKVISGEDPKLSTGVFFLFFFLDLLAWPTARNCAVLMSAPLDHSASFPPKSSSYRNVYEDFSCDLMIVLRPDIEVTLLDASSRVECLRNINRLQKPT